MATYHIKDVVCHHALTEKFEKILNEIPGKVISICQNPEYPDNWRIFWVED